MCEHKFKHNKEQDFVFCEKCGERWTKKTSGVGDWWVNPYVPYTPHYVTCTPALPHTGGGSWTDDVTLCSNSNPQ